MRRRIAPARGRLPGASLSWLRAPDQIAAPVPTPVAALIAIGAGLLGLLAFPRFGIWPLAAASVASLSVAVHGRRSRQAGWLGFLYGLAFFVPLLHWTGVYVGPAPWLLLAAAEAGYLAALGAALAVVQRLRLPALWIAAGWVAMESLRDRWPFGGFPWARLAFSQADSPLRWFAALGGAPLVSFMTALGGGGLAWVLLRLRPPRAAGGHLSRLRPLVPGAAVLAAVPVVGLLCGLVLDPGPDRPGHTATVAVIQGSVPNLGLSFEQRPRQVLDNHVAETLALAAEVRAGRAARPELVVWPENSSDLDPYRDATARAEIETAVHAIGVPILVGAILQDRDPTKRLNAGILWSPTTGPGATYVKRHPVPFAEYIPLRSLARRVSSKVDLVTQDMVAGHGNGLLTGGPVPIGDVICFEVAYDGLVRSSVLAGAQLLVVQTNNATFGTTAETYQQLAMSRLRAVETGRTVLQASTTGVSAVIGPDGQVRSRSGALFTPAALDASVPLRTVLTPATRLGAIPEWFLTGLFVLGWLVALGDPDRTRRPATPGRRDDGDPVDPSSPPAQEAMALA